MNLKNLFILLFMLTYSLPSFSQFGKQWLLCKTTEDCAKIAGVCGNTDSVNKKYLKEFNQFVKRMEADSFCLRLSIEEKKRNETLEASCVAGQCKVVEPKK